ncbi:MAG TPA: twin-arginine translocase subunit TatC [Actinomycetes bacterium]|nr:twin-arginine translocase subunit TatC [Actinomycetes bacterium]
MTGFAVRRRRRRSGGADPEGRMPLMDHLRELRGRVIKSLIALVPGTIVGWVFYDQIAHFLADPVCKLPSHGAPGTSSCGPLVINGLLGPFNLQIKVAVVTGLVIAAPVWLYQIWAFVTPGLHRNEKRWGLVFLGSAVPLFFAGAGLCYLLLPKITKILLGFTPSDVGNLVDFNSYLSLVIRLILVFGLAFEIPVFIVLLNAVGVLPAHRLRSWWRQIVFGVFLFAAVATPTGDPVTMTVLAVPLVVLILGAYVIARTHDRRRAVGVPDLSSVPDDEASPLDDTDR